VFARKDENVVLSDRAMSPRVARLTEETGLEDLLGEDGVVMVVLYRALVGVGVLLVFIVVDKAEFYL